MKYVVVEIQKNAQGQISNLVTAYDDKAAAESHYHTILAAAALATIPIHGAVIIDETCMPIAWQAYVKDTE